MTLFCRRTSRSGSLEVFKNARPRLFEQTSSDSTLVRIMFTRVTERSMYNMAELRSVVQKMLRYPGILPEGSLQFHYFLDEYLGTLKNNPVNLLLFVTEDCGQCHPAVLERIVELVNQGKKATREDYHRTLWALAKQPVDRSAAYLSVACLAFVEPLNPSEVTTGHWADVVELGKAEFAACMEHIVRETDAVSNEYPMTQNTMLRLAAAFTHLDHWQSRYPKSTVCPEKASGAVREVFGDRFDLGRKRVRPLVLGLMMVTRWMERANPAAIPEEAKALVWLHVGAVMAQSNSPNVRVHLSAMVAFLVLAGRLPVGREAAPLEVPDLSAVPTQPRAYAMPAVAQDRHTFRGKQKKDSIGQLEEHCRKSGTPMPNNPEYSHGPCAHATPQGFEEFVQHLWKCEKENGQGVVPLFKEEALEIYRAQPPDKRKRKFIVEKRLGSLAERSQIGCKRRRPPNRGGESGAKRRCLDWIRPRAPEDLKSVGQWEVVSRGMPIAQRPAGNKPPVAIDSRARRVIKGPFREHWTPMRAACLTRLARDVFGLVGCVPEVTLFVSDDDAIGLASPMIGLAPVSTSLVSKNAQRGMCKLHEYVNWGMISLANPIDVLKIVTAKNLVQSSDNNTSNLLVVRHYQRVYGMDFGGTMSESKLALQIDESLKSTSFGWAFSKRPNKTILSQIDQLARERAAEMIAWLESLKGDDVRARYVALRNEFPMNLAPDDYIERLNLFLVYFKRIASL